MIVFLFVFILTSLATADFLSEYSDTSEPSDSSVTFVPFYDGSSDFEDRINGFGKIFPKESMNWRRSGFYVVLDEYNWDDFVGWNLIFIPLEGNNAELFHVPAIPFIPGPQAHIWLNCVEKHIQKNSNAVLKACKNGRFFSDQNKKVLENFFNEKMPSMGIDMCVPSMQIMYRDNSGHLSYLELVSPDCYGKSLRASTILKRYSLLYEMLRQFIKLDNNGCSWNQLIQKRTLFMGRTNKPREMKDIGGRCPEL